MSCKMLDLTLFSESSIWCVWTSRSASIVKKESGRSVDLDTS